jgi:hypothetical protein
MWNYVELYRIMRNYVELYRIISNYAQVTQDDHMSGGPSNNQPAVLLVMLELYYSKDNVILAIENNHKVVSVYGRYNYKLFFVCNTTCSFVILCTCL